jgi:hypothetical protein
VDWTDLYSKIISLIIAFFNLEMKKDFIVSKIEASQDGSHYLLVAFTDPNALSQQVEAVAVRQYRLPLQKT